MPPTVRREIVLPVPRERAWELLTDEAELAGWLADEVELVPEPGAPVRAWWEGGELRDGVVEDVEVGARLRFRWWADGDDSEVEWTLEDAPGGTRVVVTEQRVTAPAPAFAWGPRLAALAQASALCPA